MFGSDEKSGMGMPGPAMAAKMMSRVPMMMGSRLSEMCGKDRKVFLFESVREMLADYSGEMTDEEYQLLVEELTGTLKERPTPSKDAGNSCC